MGDLVDLSQYAQKPVVVEPESNVVGSVEIEVLRFAGGPLDGEKSIVSKGATSVVVPGMAVGTPAWRTTGNPWPGMYLYKRLDDRLGDRMVYVGQPEQPDAEKPYVAHVQADELPGAVKWNDEDS